MPDCYCISGSESPMREWIEKELPNEVLHTDAMGNLIVHRFGNGKKVLLTIPMDEAGMIVTQITEDGYLKFETIGRLRQEFLAFQRVLVNGVSGVIALKAVHLTTKKEREKPIKTSDLFIDIGATSYEEASRVVTVGDRAVIESAYQEFGNRMIKGRGLGNRLAMKSVIALLQKTWDLDITVIFSVQREIGCRGLRVALKQTDAEVGIAIEGVLATPGEGVILTNGTDTGLKDEMLALTKDSNIPITIRVSEEKGQEEILRQSGMKVASLGIPVRNLHSASQTASLDDADALTKLLECYLEGLS